MGSDGIWRIKKKIEILRKTVPLRMVRFSQPDITVLFDLTLHPAPIGRDP
jgi:hypothetical protein